MSAYWRSVERPTRYDRPIKRFRAFTFLLTPLNAVGLALLDTVEKPLGAPARNLRFQHAGPPTSSAPDLKYDPPSPAQVENIFIDALVQACSCRKHLQVAPTETLVSRSRYLYHRTRRRHLDNGRQVRHLHHPAFASRRPASGTSLSREEYMSMLDWYQEPFSTQTAEQPYRPLRKYPTVSSDQPSSREARQLEYRAGTGTLKPRSSSLPSRSSVASEKPQRYSLIEPIELERPPQKIRPSALRTTDSISPPHEQMTVPLLSLPLPSPAESSGKYSDQPQAVTHLYKVLGQEDCTHQAAFDAYSVLPFPGVSLLSHDGIRLLFRRLSTVETKDKDSMLRYLSIVDDMKSEDIPLVEAEWNSAIAFCGQCFARINAENLESALRTWKEMEEEAAVKGGMATFNILFDMAAKAGKFVLAEMILKEMEARKLEVNRYARTGFIFYHGLKMDGEGVRRAYREFVEAGEIVDTVVMNCVIASLIRAGEPLAAEQVYERMKRMLAKHTRQPLPSPTWRETRDLGRFLNAAARKLRHQPAKLAQLRNEQLLAPNLRTYAIFIEHHVSNTGEIQRVTKLLTEMQYLGIPMNGRIFVKLFKGFAFHGGVRYTSWTRDRLESVWDAYLTAVEEAEVKVGKWVAIWSVRAFERCTGRARMLEVWDELRRKWEPDDFEQLESVMSILRDVLSDNNSK